MSVPDYQARQKIRQEIQKRVRPSLKDRSSIGFTLFRCLIGSGIGTTILFLVSNSTTPAGFREWFDLLLYSTVPAVGCTIALGSQKQELSPSFTASEAARILYAGNYLDREVAREIVEIEAVKTLDKGSQKP